MLRESIQADGQTIDLEGLADPACKEITGLKHSKTLIEQLNLKQYESAKNTLGRD